MVKKGLSTFLVLAFFLLVLSGCGQTARLKPYSSYVHDYTYDVVHRDLGETIDFRSDVSSYNKEGMADRSITFNGVTYTGAYQTTVKHYRKGPAQVDGYATETGVSFALKSDTGELVGWSIMTGTDFDDEYLLEDVADPEETAGRIADEFAREHLKKFDQYEKTELEPTTRQKEIDGIEYELTHYIFTYTKRINGYYSMDQLVVFITSKGQICAFSKGYIGDYDRVNLKVDEEKINASVLEKAHAVYDNASNFTARDYRIDIQGIVITYDGYFAVWSTVVVTGTLDEPGAVYDENYSTELEIYTVLK